MRVVDILPVTSYDTSRQKLNIATSARETNTMGIDSRAVCTINGLMIHSTSQDSSKNSTATHFLSSIGQSGKAKNIKNVSTLVESSNIDRKMNLETGAFMARQCHAKVQQIYRRLPRCTDERKFLPLKVEYSVSKRFGSARHVALILTVSKPSKHCFTIPGSRTQKALGAHQL